MNNLIILQSSLSKHYLSILRNKLSSILDFRTALARLSQLLAIKSLEDTVTSLVEIETPLEKIQTERIEKQFVIVPILRAGLSMLDSMMYFLPEAQIGFIGQKRDEETAQAFEYYKNFPELKDKIVLIIDPMLATGGSAVATINALLEKGADLKNIKLICVISVPEGVNKVHENFPTLPIFTAALDRCLNEKKYILPGLGDAGDLWTGTS